MMGCDIHMRVEYKRKGSEKWKSGDLYLKNDDNELEVVAIYNYRNYDLFSVLANVRNKNGFIKPICKPRGIPSDATEETKQDYRDWGEDAHSASWLTYNELQMYHCTAGEEARDAMTQLMLFLEKRTWDLHCWGEDQMRIVFWFDN